MTLANPPKNSDTPLSGRRVRMLAYVLTFLLLACILRLADHATALLPGGRDGGANDRLCELVQYRSVWHRAEISRQLERRSRRLQGLACDARQTDQPGRARPGAYLTCLRLDPDA